MMMQKRRLLLQILLAKKGAGKSPEKIQVALIIVRTFCGNTCHAFLKELAKLLLVSATLFKAFGCGNSCGWFFRTASNDGYGNDRKRPWNSTCLSERGRERESRNISETSLDAVVMETAKKISYSQMHAFLLSVSLFMRKNRCQIWKPNLRFACLRKKISNQFPFFIATYSLAYTRIAREREKGGQSIDYRCGRICQTAKPDEADFSEILNLARQIRNDSRGHQERYKHWPGYLTAKA